MVKITTSEIFTHSRWNGGAGLRHVPGMLQKRRFRRTFIREWRLHRGLTLEQLADRVEMTASHLSMLERGQRGYAQSTLEQIAHALQTDPASLLMRQPGDDEMWSLWDEAKPGVRRQITEIAKTLTRTGTDD
jgi:transcriptional regulator with XRE-family HTH domain